MKKLNLLSILFLVTTISLAQTFRFGKIPDEQWNTEDCPFDSAADILILFDVGNVSIRANEEINNKDPECNLKEEFFSMKFERHLRFKVLTDCSLDSNLIYIELRNIDGNSDRLGFFTGKLQMKNGKKVNKSKISSKNLTISEHINESSI